MDEEYVRLKRPEYLVNSLSFSVNNGISEMEVRRFGKCFHIIMNPENFTDSPAIKQQYLKHLAKERSSMNDEGVIIAGYDPEPFYDWALGPCVPMFESAAPAPERTIESTLHEYLHPVVFVYYLHVINGTLTPLENVESGNLATTGIFLDDEVFSSAWPTYLPSDVELCITTTEDTVFASSSKVIINIGNGSDINKTACFFRLYFSDDTRKAIHELEKYRRITESNLNSDVPICRILGVVKDTDNKCFGLLLTYIDCEFLTLRCAARADTPLADKQKWVDQVTDALARLHEAALVWGDANPSNVLIDKSRDAWIIIGSLDSGPGIYSRLCRQGEH